MQALRSILMTNAVFALWCGPAFANAQCRIEGSPKAITECVTSACSSQDRTLSVQFKGGRRIYVLGHNHGDRDEIFENFQKLGVSQQTDDWTSRLHDFQRTFKDTISQAREDLKYAENLFAQDPNLKFMAVEAASDRYLSILQSYSPAFAKLRERARTANVADEEAENVLLLAGSLPTYLALAKPGWMNFSITPIEDRELVEAERAADQVVASRLSALDPLFKTRPEMEESVRNDRISINVIRYQGLRLGKDQFDAVVADVNAKADLQPYNQDIIDYYASLIASSAASMDRDVQTAKNLVSQETSGILVIGQAHLFSIGSELQKLCLAER